MSMLESTVVVNLMKDLLSRCGFFKRFKMATKHCIYSSTHIYFPAWGFEAGVEEKPILEWSV